MTIRGNHPVVRRPRRAAGAAERIGRSLFSMAGRAELPGGRLDAAFLRRAIDAAPDGVVVVDPDGVIRFANPAALRMFGHDSLDGLPVETLLPDRLVAGHRAHREGYAAAPRAREMGAGLDLRGRRADGGEFPVEVALSPVDAPDGPYVVAIARDITERQTIAAELMVAHDELTLADDRERIARDLHDTVIQRLFAVGLSLQGALVAARSEPALSERIERAVDEIDGTIRDIRTAIFSLHTDRLTGTGLRDEVLIATREAARALGFEPRVVFEGPVDTATSDAVRDHLVPTLREALSNVIKHAGATRVSVTVAVVDREIVLQVTDDGDGVGPRPATTGGNGTGNMRDRAVALGGTCELRARDSGGTTLDWRVPAHTD